MPTTATTKIKTCAIRTVPEDKFIEAAMKAIQENPANAPNRRLPRDMGFGVPGPVEMAVLTKTRWKPGRTLKVKFLGGEPRVRERIVPFAKSWEEHANLTFDFVGDGEPAEIRIAFADDGSWSYLGTDALVITPNQATMNYGWLTPTGPEDEYRRVVLHEFGHAMGAVHEHSHPDHGIPWDREKVYQYYMTTQGWTRRDVDAQVFARYSQSETNFSEYDKDSIMHYPVPTALTIGDFEIGWNRDLSDSDKTFMAAIYPRDKSETELESGKKKGKISNHGEIDTYYFRLPSGSHAVTLQTHGRTDLVMSLFGPDDETSLIAWDDDSGARLNPRLDEHLDGGRYVVRIEHWRPTGTGEYEIEMRRS